VAKMGQVFYGWFDDVAQREPTYDPPHDAPCLYCGRPISKDDVRTISLMTVGSAYAKRSYFYRTHRLCAEATEKDLDNVIFDMIARNGD
jgi:hypothetical protein